MQPGCFALQGDDIPGREPQGLQAVGIGQMRIE
jgi:hypothetical protein